MKTTGYAAHECNAKLVPYTFERREQGAIPHRLVIDMASLEVV